jgi:hypothetical protein
MNTQNDTDVVVRRWLDEGVTVMPQHVLNGALYEIASTRQRYPTDTWHAFILAHLGKVAAVVVALMIGLYALGSYVVTAPPTPGPSVPVASVSPTPSAEVSSSPRPFQLSGSGALDPNSRYAIDGLLPARITFSVPGGWYYGGYQLREAIALRHDYTGAIWFGQPANVFQDACHWRLGPKDPPLGPTAFDLAEVLRAIPALQPSTPQAVSFGSFSGLRMTIRDGEPASGCDEDRLGVFFNTWSYWPMLRDSSDLEGPRQSTLYILDVDGSRLVIELQRTDDAGSYVNEELQQILGSIEITPE